MNKKIFELITIALLFVIATFLFQITNNKNGKYIPFGAHKMIIDTTNGNVYAPILKDNNGFTKWQKMFSFQSKNELYEFEKLEKIRHKEDLIMLNEIEKEENK